MCRQRPNSVLCVSGGVDSWFVVAGSQQQACLLEMGWWAMRRAALRNRRIA